MAAFHHGGCSTPSAKFDFAFLLRYQVTSCSKDETHEGKYFSGSYLGFLRPMRYISGFNFFSHRTKEYSSKNMSSCRLLNKSSSIAVLHHISAAGGPQYTSNDLSAILFYCFVFFLLISFFSLQLFSPSIVELVTFPVVATLLKRSKCAHPIVFWTHFGLFSWALSSLLVASAVRGPDCTSVLYFTFTMILFYLKLWRILHLKYSINCSFLSLQIKKKICVQPSISKLYLTGFGEKICFPKSLSTFGQGLGLTSLSHLFKSECSAQQKYFACAIRNFPSMVSGATKGFNAFHTARWKLVMICELHTFHRKVTPGKLCIAASMQNIGIFKENPIQEYCTVLKSWLFSTCQYCSL